MSPRRTIASFVSFCVMPLAAIALSGCGGANAKETPVQKTKTPVVDTGPAKTGETPKTGPEGDLSGEKPPAAPKFAVPNVPFVEGAAAPIRLGGNEVKVEACAFHTSGPELLSDKVEEAILDLAAGNDGAVYVLDKDQKVRRYVLQPGEGCALALDSSFGKDGILTLPEPPHELQVLDDGTLVVFMSDATHLYKNNRLDTVACYANMLSEDGKTGYTLDRLTITRGAFTDDCKQAAWNYKGWKIDPDDGPAIRLGVIRERNGEIALGGTASDGFAGITVHSPDGKVKLKFGSKNRKGPREEETICSVHEIRWCGPGICALDTTCRRLSVWDAKKGTFIDSVKLKDLLRLPSPWVVGLATTKSAAFMGAVHDEKAEAGKAQRGVGVIFRITGI